MFATATTAVACCGNDMITPFATALHSHLRFPPYKIGHPTTRETLLVLLLLPRLPRAPLDGVGFRHHTQATSQWFELQDLHVSETMPQLIGE